MVAGPTYPSPGGTSASTPRQKAGSGGPAAVSAGAEELQLVSRTTTITPIAPRPGRRCAVPVVGLRPGTLAPEATWSVEVFGAKVAGDTGSGGDHHHRERPPQPEVTDGQQRGRGVDAGRRLRRPATSPGRGALPQGVQRPETDRPGRGRPPPAPSP